MQLKYQDGIIPQWNRNIANQQWGAANNLVNVFTYGYDKLNRLLSASSTGITMSETITYYVTGNIKSLDRDGTGAKVYHYNGNQLNAVSGLTNSYSYDANGNASIDGRNGMSLTYNYLNLPDSANKVGTALSYSYDAAGQKLVKIIIILSETISTGLNTMAIRLILFIPRRILHRITEVHILINIIYRIIWEMFDILSIFTMVP